MNIMFGILALGILALSCKDLLLGALVVAIVAPLLAWNFPWFKCLLNYKKSFRSFCLLWEVWYLLHLVGMPIMMLIMRRFVCVTHIACSLQDIKECVKRSRLRISNKFNLL